MSRHRPSAFVRSVDPPRRLHPIELATIAGLALVIALAAWRWQPAPRLHDATPTQTHERTR